MKGATCAIGVNESTGRANEGSLGETPKGKPELVCLLVCPTSLGEAQEDMAFRRAVVSSRRSGEARVQGVRETVEQASPAQPLRADN